MIKVQTLDLAIPETLIPAVDKSALGALVADIAEAARNHWIKLAAKDPSSFRNDYINGIQPVQLKPGHFAVVSLVGEVPHMLEDGAPRTDMRDILLGDNVPVVPVGERGKHLSKNHQFYRSIPFRHTTPGTGKGVGQAMGSAYGSHGLVIDAQKLGKAIYRASRKLGATTTNPYGKTKWGDRLDTSRMSAGLAGGRGIPKLRPHHKTDIYSGMVRFEKTYEKATQSSYGTFRTISTAVRDESWIRAPIPARHYAEKVGEFVSKVAPMALEAFLTAQGGQY